MPRIILKCRYLKHEKAHLAHLVRYIATREGVEMARDTHDHLPATARQKQLIDELLQALPETQESYEYHDYQANPTMGNASAFIAISIEQNMDLVAKKENYVDYIASRPGVEKRGTHGLFTDAGVPVILSRVQEEVARHEGNVWTFILSIRREDAVRLGYDNVKRWEALLRGKRMQMAEAMKMSPENLVWYAAFHQAGHHPHVHMIAYSRDPGKGFLTEKGIEQMRAMYAKEIFHQDMYEMYLNQTFQRNELVRASADPLKKLFGQDQGRWEESSKLEQLMTQLAADLKQTKGRKVYGYLPPRIKQQVDRIVDVLSMNPAVAGCYQRWYDSRLEILHTYSDQTPERPPLSRQKEFKQIKNMIIREAMELNPDRKWNLEHPMDNMSRTIVEGREDSLDAALWYPEDATAADDMSCMTESEEGYAKWTDEYRYARNVLYGTDEAKPDFETAWQMMYSEARQGNAFAMCDLGRMLRHGRGCEPDLEASRAWYLRALRIFLNAEEVKTSAYIEYRIGKMYEAGQGAEQSYGEAADWYELSAMKGNRYALYSLGMMYQRGQGVIRDLKKSADLLKRSMMNGNPYAAWEYGKMLRDGIGLEKNGEKANLAFKTAFFGFLTLAEKQMDDNLMYRIGKMYQDGTGTEKDEGKAVPYFQRAIEFEHVHAMCALADIQIQTGTQEGIQQGIRLLEQSAALENSNAEYKLGKLYHDGLYIDRNLGASVYWLNHGAGHGNQHAQYLLGKLYLFQQTVRDEESGVFWLQKSASQGNLYAAYLLEHRDEWGRMRLQSGIIRLFHHLSDLFEEQEKEDHSRTQGWIDRKRRRRLKEKKMAQGIHG